MVLYKWGVGGVTASFCTEQKYGVINIDSYRQEGLTVIAGKKKQLNYFSFLEINKLKIRLNLSLKHLSYT